MTLSDRARPRFPFALLATLASLVLAPTVASAQASATGPAAPVAVPAVPAVAPITLPETVATETLPLAAISPDRLALVEGLRTRVSGLAGVRAVRFDPADPDVLKIITYREFQLYLPRIAERIAQAGLDGDAGLDLIAAQTAAGLDANNPFEIAALRVVVRPTQAVDAFEQLTGVDDVPNRVVRRAFAPGLDEVLVANAGSTIAYVPMAQLPHLQLGETDAFSWGRTNTEVLARTVRFEEEDGIRIAMLDGNYETSLLTIDRLWTQLATDMGAAIAVAAPTRSRLLVARANDARAMARLRDIARTEGAGEHGLSDRVMLRQGRNWVPQ
jgi:hypothetical protein